MEKDDKASLAQALKAVVCGLFALRTRSEFEKDTSSLTLKHVVIAALCLMVFLVSVLVLIVRIIIG